MDLITNEPMLITLCPENESLLISKEVLEALENPKHIQLLVNNEQRRLLLQACDITARYAIVIPENNTDSFSMSAHVFLKNIKKLMDWDDDYARIICGAVTVLSGHRAVLFKLDDATKAQVQE